MSRKVRLPECQVCYGSLFAAFVCDCGFVACDECYQHVFMDLVTEVEDLIRLGCMSCKAVFPVKRVRDVLGAARLSALVDRCAERQAVHLEATVIPTMRDRKEREKVATKLVAVRFPHISPAGRRRVVSQMTIGASLKCAHPGCEARSFTTPGEDRGLCPDHHLTCAQCLAPISEGSPSSPSGPQADPSGVQGPHRCDPDVLKTLAKIKEDTKECPGCATPTHRIAGCDHMYCVVCKSDWDWQTCTLKSRGHNPHNPEANRRRDPRDVPGGDFPPLRSPEGSLTSLFHALMPVMQLLRLIMAGLAQKTHLPDTAKHASGRLSRKVWLSKLATVQIWAARSNVYRDLLEDLFIKALDLLRADTGDVTTEQALAELMHSTNQKHRDIFTYSAFPVEGLGDMLTLVDGTLVIGGVPDP